MTKRKRRAFVQPGERRAIFEPLERRTLLSANTVQVLASTNSPNGDGPYAGLILSGDTLYGTTAEGGANGYGEVFSVPITGGSPTILVSFNGLNGASPMAGLVLSGNTLYGTTSEGGEGVDSLGRPIGAGTVFSVPLTGGSPTVLASFDYDNNGGSRPNDLLLSGNTLYGTTDSGGDYNEGTVFSLPITGGSPTLLTSFDHQSYSPNGDLVLSGNTLYGTTVAMMSTRAVRSSRFQLPADRSPCSRHSKAPRTQSLMAA